MAAIKQKHDKDDPTQILGSKSMSPVVPRLPANAEWHDPDNNDPAAIKHLASSGAHVLGDCDAAEVEDSNAEDITCDQSQNNDSFANIHVNLISRNQSHWGYIFVADSMGLSSFKFLWWAIKDTRVLKQSA